jgi:hypothetical protein
VATRQPDRIAMLEAEVTRLHGELRILDRQWSRKHLLAAFGILAIPAYFLFGGVVAAVVLVCTPALIATQAYLVGVRRLECRQLIEETKRELAYAQQRAASAAAASATPDPALA